MATAAYDYDVDSESLLDEEETKTQPKAGTRGPSVSVSPSPFHVPVGVTLRITRSGACAIEFSYPNEERPDRTPYRLAGDANVTVSLGNYTRKILRLYFESALEIFRQGKPQFDLLGGSKVWSTQLPPPARPACVRNAQTIEILLSKMPNDLHADILKFLERQATKSH